MWQLLIWEGELSNHRVREVFGLQTVQASRLIAAFRERWPSVCDWDGSRKAFVLAAAGQERLRRAKAGTYSFEGYVRLVGAGQTVGSGSLLENWRLDVTEVNPAIFRVLRAACEDRRQVLIRYRSMTHPKAAERVISPHAMVGVGRRWHVRAWCHENEGFRDFVLGRISAAQAGTGAAPRRREDDAAWNQVVPIRLVPHRQLDTAQAEVIRDELFGGAASRRIDARACLVCYVIQDLRAALHPERERPPAFQIEVTNAAQLASHLFEAE